MNSREIGVRFDKDGILILSAVDKIGDREVKLSPKKYELLRALVQPRRFGASGLFCQHSQFPGCGQEL